jgi:hypothetical protein
MEYNLTYTTQCLMAFLVGALEGLTTSLDLPLVGVYGRIDHLI